MNHRSEHDFSCDLCQPFHKGALKATWLSPPCVKEGGTHKRDGRIVTNDSVNVLNRENLPPYPFGKNI